mgnify:CR=1 FL=1
MPIGIITDVLSLFVGGLLGGVIGKHINGDMKIALNNTFGFCAMAIGVRLIVKMNSLSAVVLAMIIGAIVGEIFKLEDHVNRGVKVVAPKIVRNASADEIFYAQFCAVAVLFCCSGTGWYGCLNEGFTRDISIMVTKAILDFFTAIIFAAVLGKLVSYLAVPQAIIYAILFSVSRLVVPLVSQEMIADFSAVGGIVELATGMRIAGVKRDTKTINLIPAMLLVFPISALWTFLFG